MGVKMKYTAGKSQRGDIEIIYEPTQKKNIEIELETSVERLYGEQIRAVITNTAKSFGINSGKFSAVDDGALPYVLRARVEAVIRAAKEAAK